MNRKLETLDAQRARRFAEQQRPGSSYFGEPRPNGIACPKCGEELFDTRPNVFLTSDPAQKDIHCPACGYVGYRIA